MVCTAYHLLRLCFLLGATTETSPLALSGWLVHPQALLVSLLTEMLPNKHSALLEREGFR